MSDVIVSCTFPDNCIPEENNQKLGCKVGHKGPVCEECDVKGEVWGS